MVPTPPPFLFLSIYMCFVYIEILKYWNLMGSLWQFIQGCLSQLSTMIYTAIDTFYLTDEQLKNSPSRKDGIDEATETTLRIYGCDLIQESGILLRLYPVIFLLFFIFIFYKNAVVTCNSHISYFPLVCLP